MNRPGRSADVIPAETDLVGLFVLLVSLPAVPVPAARGRRTALAV
jgi:hypothetical protein